MKCACVALALAMAAPVQAQDADLARRQAERQAQREAERKAEQHAAALSKAYADFDKLAARSKADIAKAMGATCFKDKKQSYELESLLFEDQSYLEQFLYFPRKDLPELAPLRKTAEDLLKQVFAAYSHLQHMRCPPPEVPPPPPPPPKPPAGQSPAPPAQPGEPAGLTPTHRAARCERCEGLAAALNRTADEYASAVRQKSPNVGLFRDQMAKLSHALDDCERSCALLVKPAPSAPPKVPYRPMKPVFQRAVCPPGQFAAGPDCVTSPTPK
jgi:hypothetical protein